MNYAFKANKCRLFLQFENHFFFKSLKTFSIYIFRKIRGFRRFNQKILFTPNYIFWIRRQYSDYSASRRKQQSLTIL
jgi:hypothetical protein